MIKERDEASGTTTAESAFSHLLPPPNKPHSDIHTDIHSTTCKAHSNSSYNGNPINNYLYSNSLSNGYAVASGNAEDSPLATARVIAAVADEPLDLSATSKTKTTNSSSASDKHASSVPLKVPQIETKFRYMHIVSSYIHSLPCGASLKSCILECIFIYPDLSIKCHCYY